MERNVFDHIIPVHHDKTTSAERERIFQLLDQQNIPYAITLPSNEAMEKDETLILWLYYLSEDEARVSGAIMTILNVFPKSLMKV
jgi:hypothetical protein